MPGMGLIASSLSSVINAGSCARDGPVAGAGEGELLHMVPVGSHMWTGSSSTMGLLGGQGWVGSGGSMGTGCGGFSPRSSRWLGVCLGVIPGFL